MKKSAVLFLCLVIVLVMGLCARPSEAGYKQINIQIQQKLKDLGYDPGPIDGIRGEKTERALRSFQKDHGLAVTGQMDQETANELGLPITVRTMLLGLDGITIDQNICLANVTISQPKIGGPLEVTGQTEFVVSGQRVSQSSIVCLGAVHKFKGRVEMQGHGFEDYIFEGDQNDPLTFMCGPKGYTYLGGKGRIIRKKDGKVVLDERPDKESGLGKQVKGTNELFSQAVYASTLYKLLMLDMGHNLIGLGWPDREREGCGMTAITTAMTGIRSKYKFEHPTKEKDFDIDLPTPLNASGRTGKHGPLISLQVPENWYELFHFANWGRLPTVKYKAGTIFLNLKLMTVTFNENIKVMVGDKEYTYSDGKFIPTEP